MMTIVPCAAMRSEEKVWIAPITPKTFTSKSFLAVLKSQSNKGIVYPQVREVRESRGFTLPGIIHQNVQFPTRFFSHLVLDSFHCIDISDIHFKTFNPRLFESRHSS